MPNPTGVPRSKIIAAIKNEITAHTALVKAGIGSFEKSIYTREGHERGTGHEKGSLMDHLARAQEVLDPTLAKRILGGVVAPRTKGK